MRHKANWVTLGQLLFLHWKQATINQISCQENCRGLFNQLQWLVNDTKSLSIFIPWNRFLNITISSPLLSFGMEFSVNIPGTMLAGRVSKANQLMLLWRKSWVPIYIVSWMYIDLRRQRQTYSSPTSTSLRDPPLRFSLWRPERKIHFKSFSVRILKPRSIFYKVNWVNIPLPTVHGRQN